MAHVGDRHDGTDGGGRTGRTEDAERGPDRRRRRAPGDHATATTTDP